MARMSIDDGLGRDPRLDCLADLCGWTRRETAGCLQLDIWPLCYDRVTPNIPARDLDIAANRGAIHPVRHPNGFSGALLESGLARPSTRRDTQFEWVRKDKPVVLLSWRDLEWRNRIYVCGATERIAYLIKSEESGRLGGHNSGKSRGNPTKGPLRDPSRDPLGSGNPIPTATATPTSPSPVPDGTTEKNSATLSAGGAPLKLVPSGEPTRQRTHRPKPSDPTPDECAAALRVLGKLSERNGVRYSGTGEHVGLIVRHLRDGVPEMHLRYVIGYCAAELNWATKPDLIHYLRPETLFGPKTLSKYLDPALAWVSKLPDDRAEQREAAP